MAECYIGIDLGTSGVRACAIDAHGEPLGEARAALPAALNPSPGHHEQDPLTWWKTCLQVLDDLLSDRQLQPRAISVDGTSSTLLLCDREGHPLTPALMYNDTRAGVEAQQLRSLAPPNAAVHSPGSALAKLCHLQLDRPPGAQHALHQADWISGQLSGEFARSDENNALKMGYDPVARRWPDWLADCPIDRQLLPDVVPVGQAIGSLHTELQQRWRLSRPVNIVAGTTDSNAATLACGIHAIGEASSALGSTLVLKVLSNRPVFDASYGIYSHRLGDRWLVGGASNSGGGVLAQYFTPAQLALLSERIDPTTASGLDYYPLPGTGERFPLNDPQLQPRLTPIPKDDVRFLHGLLEGIARIEQRGYNRLQELGAPYPTRVLSSGGGASNAAWTKIREHLLGVPVRAARHSEAAYGSALIAAGLIY